MSASPVSEANVAKSASVEHRPGKRLPRWIATTSMAVTIVVASFMLWSLLFSRQLVSSENRRAFRDLSMLTDTIASWPPNIGKMARANLIASRLEPPGARSGAAGWQARASSYHPRFRTIEMNYAIAGGARRCPRDARAERGGEWINREGQLVATGAFLLYPVLDDDIRRSSPAGDAAPPAQARQRMLATLNARARGLRVAPGAAAAGPVVCYQVSLPLRQMVEVGVAAPRFRHILLAEQESGEIVAQLGAEPLPVTKLGDLQPGRSITASVADFAGAVRGEPSAAPPAAARPQGLALFPVVVGGEAYTAYQRPFSIVAGDAEAGPARYVAVALAPKQALAAEVAALPPVGLIGFALALTLLLTLAPTLKLHLIGPGEAMSRGEVRTIWLGLMLATVTATVAICFARDVSLRRSAVAAEADRTASAMRNAVVADLGAALRRTSDIFRVGAGWACQPRNVSPRHQDALPTLEAAQAWFAAGGARSKGQPDCPSGAAAPGGGAAIGAAPRLPPLESLLVVDTSGQLMERTVIAVWRDDAGGRPDLAERGYFRNALEGNLLSPPPATPIAAAGLAAGVRAGWSLTPRYAIEQVRSQADGIAKTVLAFPIDRSPPPARGVSREEAPPRHGVATAVAVLPSLLSPVLAPRLQFLVIDADQPDWPVLFHSNPYRASFSRLRDELRSRRAADAVARARAADAAAPIRFGGMYDGRRKSFHAVGLPGTSWVLLVYSDTAGVDAAAGGAVQIALAMWLGAALAAGLVGWPAAKLLARLRRPAWLAGLRRRNLALMPSMAIAAALFAATALRPVRDLAHLLAFFPPFGVNLALARRRSRLRRPPADAGSTQAAARRIRLRLLAALLLGGVVPAALLHADARRFVADRVQAADTAAVAEAARQGFAARIAVLRAFDREHRDSFRLDDWPAAICRGAGPSAGMFVTVFCSPAQARPMNAGIVARRATAFIDGPVAPSLAACADARDAGCTPGTGTAPFALAAPREAELAPAAALALAGGIALFVALVWTAARCARRGLVGLGAPLEAVAYPMLRTGPDGAPMLRPEILTLVVGAPLALQQLLLSTGRRIGLDETEASELERLCRDLRSGDGGAEPIILCDLEKTYCDGARRRAALAALERIVACRDRARAIGGSPPAIALLAELSPLDRLMQSYERDACGAEAAGAAEAYRSREEIRWSKLLERFHTCMFGAQRRLSPPDPALSDAERTAIEELAFLPEHAIESLLDMPVAPPRPKGDARFCLSERSYASVYDRPVRLWAKRFRSHSREAAIDYLRSMLIEHYEACWQSSSWAERVVLHHLAHDRRVNVATAFPLRSLVRRGLVVLGPAPRLMNASFARFIRETEKPAQIREWRRDLAPGRWQLAQVPFLGLVLVAILTIVFVLVNANEPFKPLLPLLLATVPALLQSAGVIRK